MKVVVLVSGGMDSVTALYQAARDHEVVSAVSFDYASKHNHKELPAAVSHAAKLGIPHRIIRIAFINELFQSSLLQSGGPIPDGHYEDDSMRQTVVPFRNGIMLSIACGFAESRGAEGLVIAAHAGDHAVYPDCRAPFMEAMAQAMLLGSYAGIQLLRPFVDLHKTDIVRIGTELGVDFAQTWSCYKGRDLHCGTCGTCVERREAFLLAQLPDPTTYADPGPLPARATPS